MATKTADPTYTLDGKALSYDRYRYELAIRQQVTLEQVNRIASAQTAQVVGAASALGQQEMGGFLRKVLPPLIDQYGNVNAVAAMNYYDQIRTAWLIKNGTGRGSRATNQRRMAQRVAGAKLSGQVYKARLPLFNSAEKADGVVNYAMALFMDQGFQAMDAGVQNSLTRAVASYHHDTMLYNASLDEAVYKVQRVAEAKACAFCRMVAFKSGKTVYARKQNGELTADALANLRTAEYAIKFHDHCHCTIETLYQGDQPIRPDYYDQFEAEYTKFGGDLNEWRANTNAR